MIKRIAILGGGPSGLFVFKRFVEANAHNVEIEIFEKNKELGSGMPYSMAGAGEEHITNVSGNEIPQLETSLSDWVKSLEPETLKRFNIQTEKFSDYKVLPRLLFGQYLSDQFHKLERKAKAAGIVVTIHRGVMVTDIVDDTEQRMVEVVTDMKEEADLFHHVVVCTGHDWPSLYEGKVEGYFDSPYPPVKLAGKTNHPIAIRGSSLTAIDAIRTLARHNGEFITGKDRKISFKLRDDSNDFKLVLHSRSGLLPAVRFHLEDSHLGKEAVLTKEEIDDNKNENDGFLSLDFVFEKNFKQPLREKDPEFYNKIAQMEMEDFVEFIMKLRESVDAFDLFKGEYIEAEKSINRQQSVYWKEMLGVLSFAMNYPAKYFSAEDMLRLHKALHPLISIVIAYVPQSSVEEMLALHDAGLLELISVGDDSYVKPGDECGATYHYTDSANKARSTHYKTYIDAIGQPHLSYTQLPYKSLTDKKTVSPAKIKFRNTIVAIKEKEAGNKDVIIDKNGYYLNVPGIAINDNFQVLDEFGAYNERIFMMAVPYIAGYNPDYSGLDFCEAASKFIVHTILKESRE
ncbi:MAG: FAD/NAD(P)-binding protein [Ginsengibacter sp.]